MSGTRRGNDRHVITRRIPVHSGRTTAVCLFGLCLILSASAFAGWEAGAKAGFDTNINRDTGSGENDQFLSGYLSFVRGPTGERRLDWTMSTTAEGAAFSRFSDLGYVSATVTPGLVLLYGGTHVLSASPFLSAKSVIDSDQSSVSFGVHMALRHQLRRDMYIGEYYLYTDNRAEVETFSYTEHAVGIFSGFAWTSAVSTEIKYEFSRGDSFRSLGPGTSGSAAGQPGGTHHRFSDAFGAEIARELVTRHAIGLNIGILLGKSLFSRAGYTFTNIDGDLGTSTSHAGYFGVGYRF